MPFKNGVTAFACSYANISSSCMVSVPAFSRIKHTDKKGYQVIKSTYKSTQ